MKFFSPLDKYRKKRQIIDLEIYDLVILENSKSSICILTDTNIGDNIRIFIDLFDNIRGQKSDLIICIETIGSYEGKIDDEVISLFISKINKLLFFNK